MSFHVKLYEYTGEPETVVKTLTSAKENDVSGVLFQDVEDISTPYVELDKDKAINPGTGKATFFTANYAYIPQMSRYYFITGKEIIDNDHYVIRLECDVLMTYSAAIKATRFFIERSDSAGSWYLPDPQIPMDSQLTLSEANILTFTPFDITPGSGKPSYVVKTAGGQIPTALGDGPAKYVKDSFLSPCNSIFYYSLSRTATLNLAHEISSAEMVQHWFDDLKSGIFGLMAFPFEIDYTAADLTPLVIGTTTSVVSGYPLKSSYHETSYYSKNSNSNYGPLAVPSDFRMGSGDTVIKLFLPFVGWQQLDPAIVKERPYLNVSYKTNLLSGTGVCTVYLLRSSSSVSDTKDIVGQFEYVAGLEIPITVNTSIEVTKNAINTAMSSLLAVAGAAITENPALIGGAIASGAANVTRALTKPVETGTLGSSSFSSNPLYSQKMILQYRLRKSPVLDDNDQKGYYKARYGLMYQKSALISTLSGKTVVKQFEMDLPAGCTTKEFAAIKQRLAEGVLV